MNKKEFIIEAALRMVSQGMPVHDIPQAARQLADELFPEAPIHHGKPDTDSIEVLLKEVDRLDQENAKAETERYRQMYGHDKYHPQKSGHAVRLHKVFQTADIKTVGDLLSQGSREFLKMRNVGQLCVEIVDQALVNLYNITTW